MTNRNTKDEWIAVIEQAEKGIPSTSTEYKAPGLGSEEFAKSIDHTLLKLESTQSQIDELCEEARRHNFKVNSCSPSWLSNLPGPTNQVRGIWSACRDCSPNNILPSPILSQPYGLAQLCFERLSHNHAPSQNRLTIFHPVSMRTTQLRKSRSTQSLRLFRSRSLRGRLP